MTPYDDSTGCRYIIGELKSDEPWRYCNAPRRDGSSYCKDHHAICYHRTRRRERVETGEVTTSYLADRYDNAA